MGTSFLSRPLRFIRPTTTSSTIRTSIDVYPAPDPAGAVSAASAYSTSAVVSTSATTLGATAAAFLALCMLLHACSSPVAHFETHGRDAVVCVSLALGMRPTACVWC